MININLVLALILCNILALFYQVIIEIFTILCRINGMTIDKSRFQVISILTGTGYTTSESESMLLTRKRRKLTQRMMLFSYIFNILIVSTLVNLFMSTSSTNINEITLGIGLTVLNLFLMFGVRKSHKFKNFLDKIVVKVANRNQEKKGTTISIYDTYGNDVIAELELYKLRDSLKNKKLKELDLKEKYHIQILMIKRHEEVIDNIGAETELQENDIVIVFGKLKNIKATFLKKE